MNVPPRRPILPLKVLAASSRILLWLVVMAWMVCAAAWAGLHYFIVPRIGELRPELEMRASEVLGVPVRIGAIAAHSESLFPSFELTDVRLYDRAGRPALLLPRVVATISLRSIWRLGFEQLAIERPELDVLRARDGRIYVAGIELPQNRTGDGRAADWVFSQTEWVVEGGQVSWRDEWLGAPPLQLSQLDLRVRNGARVHEFRLDATPPAALGSRFSLRGRFRQPLFSSHAGFWQRWDGQMYAVFERVDVAQLRRHVPLQLDVMGGSGALRAWLDVEQGRVAGAAADVALRQVGLRLRPDLPALDLSRLTGRIGGRLPDGGAEFYTQNLKFDTVDGLRWPGGDVRFSVGETAGKARHDVRLTGVDLAALAQLSQRVPLESRVHAWLAQFAPQGRVEQLQLRWSGPWNQPDSYEAHGRLHALALAAQAGAPPSAPPAAPASAPPAAPASAPSAAAPGPESATAPALPAFPGVAGLSLDFDLNQDGGRAGVLVHQGHVDLPGLFEQPRIALDQFGAELHWNRQRERLTVQVLNAQFANADAQGDFQLRWDTILAPQGGSQRPARGTLDLQGSMSRAELAAVHRYLPVALNAKVRDYLRQALVQGQAGGVRFRVKGPLRNFPFRQPGQGEFRITANVLNATFAYVPPALHTVQDLTWPALSELQGSLILDRASLALNDVSARLARAPQVRVVQGDARIPTLDRDAEVLTRLQLKGPLDGVLRGLVGSSPLDPMIGGLFKQARASGDTEAQLDLQLPLQHLDRSRVRGQLRLAGNELRFAPHLPSLTRVRGIVHFSEKGFALAGAQARLLGGDVRAEGGTIATPGSADRRPPRLRVQGTLTAQGLRDEGALGALQFIGQQASGSADYTAEFGMEQGVPAFQLNSTLQGLALNLPTPLGKSAPALLPLRLQAAPLAPGQDGAVKDLRLDVLRLNLGNLVAVRYIRDVGHRPAQVLRGTIGIGMPAGENVPMPDAGVVASVAFDALDLDAWRALTPAAAGATGATRPPALPAALYDYLPTSLMVQGKALRVAGQQFDQLVAGGTREGQVWRVNLDAREISGYMEYRMADGAQAGSVYARLARLVLVKEGARGVENLLDEQPVSIPALDVVVNDLDLRGKKLGRVEVQAVNRGLARRDGGAREWRLSKLKMTMPEGEFNASGNWAVYQEASAPPSRAQPARPAAPASRGERRRTVMNFELNIANAGGLLERLGMPGLIRAGRGRMHGQASWVGSPMALDYPTLSGNFNINVETGQFLKADPGIAKLLGVLSLQSLPRRLALDFRDVFSEGFSFDFVRGDIQIEQGIAMTNNLQMKGVNAAVLMEGHTDLAKETQELRVVVVPEINAGTASLIAGWINPAVGLGTFLAQAILRGPVIAAATQEFRISGSWSDPQMSKVERSPEPEAAASGPAGGSP